MEWGGSPPLCYAPADRGRGAHYAASISPCSNVAHSSEVRLFGHSLHSLRSEDLSYIELKNAPRAARHLGLFSSTQIIT
jgi:hypothetical protein